jgi:hypothetical protein
VLASLLCAANLLAVSLVPRHHKGHKIMATSSTETTIAVPAFGAAIRRGCEANDRLAEVGRRVTASYLDDVEQYGAGVAQFERAVGEQSYLEQLPARSVRTRGCPKMSSRRALAARAARELIAA